MISPRTTRAVGSTMPVRSLRDLPKAHLHVHLEGSIRQSTLRELSEGHPGAAPQVLPDRSSLEQFLTIAESTRAVIRSRSDLERIAYEHVLDEAALGVRYLQTTFSPQLFGSIGSIEQVLRSVLSGLHNGEEETGLRTTLVCGAIRTESPAAATVLARTAVRHRHASVAAFGLVGDEMLGHAAEFAEAFRVAREGGLLSVPHAGETGGSESIRATLDHLVPDRIAHGVQAAWDPGLLTELSERRIVCDMCPTSNVRLGVITDIDTHPIAALHRQGIAVTVNADDPSFFGATILDEYEACRSTFDMPDREIADIARTSIRASGADESEVRVLLGEIAAWLDNSPDPGLG